MTTTDTRQQSYAKYEVYPQFSHLCISHLMQNSEVAWKLLKYPTANALNESNLTYDEKAALIFKGEGELTSFNVFMDIGQPNVFTKEVCIIRIAPYALKPENYVYGTLLMNFEVYCHYNINHLNNYQTRIDTMIGEFLRVFNGVEIGGIGRLAFDMMQDLNDKVANSGQLPYRGKSLFLSNKAR